MTQTLAQVNDLTPFNSALYLHPTIEAVVEYNISKLRTNGQPVATVKTIHSGPNAAKASAEDAGGLEPILCLAHEARIMLTANLWVDMGLVNGAMGTVIAICYHNGQQPPDLPIAVTVQFDSYSGPTLSDGTVPICPLRHTWSTPNGSCSRLQLPLKLAWTVTIHKAQGLTLNKEMINIGKKEFCAGLSFVASSRVRALNDLLFDPPFPYQCVKNLANSQRLQERLLEDDGLLLLERTTLSTIYPNFTSNTTTTLPDISLINDHLPLTPDLSHFNDTQPPNLSSIIPSHMTTSPPITPSYITPSPPSTPSYTTPSSSTTSDMTPSPPSTTSHTTPSPSSTPDMTPSPPSTPSHTTPSSSTTPDMTPSPPSTPSHTTPSPPTTTHMTPSPSTAAHMTPSPPNMENTDYIEYDSPSPPPWNRFDILYIITSLIITISYNFTTVICMCMLIELLFTQILQKFCKYNYHTI